jgi:hypothetical protein
METCNSFYLINIQTLYNRHFCDSVTVTYCIVSTTTAVRDSLFPASTQVKYSHKIQFQTNGQHTFQAYAIVAQEHSTVKSAADVATE